jgi:hypothetical protein
MRIPFLTLQAVPDSAAAGKKMEEELSEKHAIFARPYCRVLDDCELTARNPEQMITVVVRAPEVLRYLGWRDEKVWRYCQKFHVSEGAEYIDIGRFNYLATMMKSGREIGEHEPLRFRVLLTVGGPPHNSDAICEVLETHIQAAEERHAAEAARS